MIEEIHALNREMIAAGARKFACGISPASNAKTLRKQPDGTGLVTEQGLPQANVTDLLETSGGLIRFDPRGAPVNRVIHAGDETNSAPIFTLVVPEEGDVRASHITVLVEGGDGTM